MEPKTRRTIIGIAGAVAAIAVAIVIAPASVGRAPAPQARGTGSCVELAADVDPKQVPVDSGYDPELDLVYAHANGRTYSMRPNDPRCRALASVRAVIDDAMTAHAENTQVACRVMADIVAERRTEVRGHRVNQAAAQRFLARRCGTTSP